MVYDLIIIGGGPAGITAGIYGARQKLNILLIAKGFGGQVAEKAIAIENYPGFEKISGLDLVQKFEKQLRKQKIDIERDEVVKLKKIKDKFFAITKSKNKFESKTAIIAVGAEPRFLGVPGEKKFIGRGLSFCVTCDGPIFNDKTVAVIGGGNSAFEAAIFLTKVAKKIYILEYGEKTKADVENQERVKRSGRVEIITNTQVKKIKGKKFVESLLCQDRRTGKDFDLPVDGIFVEIGLQPASAFVKDLVEFNKINEIKVNFETCQTKTPGLFAAGDVNVGKYKQIVTAAGEGAKAALSVYDYLKEKNNR